MTMTWTPAPAGTEGETGSHIPEQAASRYFTDYRTTDGYAWSDLADGVVVLPDGSSCYVQYQAARLAPDVAERVRIVLRTAEMLRTSYPVRETLRADDAAYLARHDALMARMDDPHSDL